MRDLQEILTVHGVGGWGSSKSADLSLISSYFGGLKPKSGYISSKGAQIRAEIVEINEDFERKHF